MEEEYLNQTKLTKEEEYIEETITTEIVDHPKEIVITNFETLDSQGVSSSHGEAIGGQFIGYLEVQPSQLGGDHENATIFAQEIEIDGRQIILTPGENDINELIVVVTNDQKINPEQAVAHFTQSALVNSSTLPVLSGEKAHAFVVGNNHIAAHVNFVDGNVIASQDSLGCVTEVTDELNHQVLIASESLPESFIKGASPVWTIAGTKLSEKDEGTEMLFIPNPVLTSSADLSLLQSAQEESKNRKLMQLACIAQEFQATELEAEDSPHPDHEVCDLDDNLPSDVIVQQQDQHITSSCNLLVADSKPVKEEPNFAQQHDGTMEWTEVSSSVHINSGLSVIQATSSSDFTSLDQRSIESGDSLTEHSQDETVGQNGHIKVKIGIGHSKLDGMTSKPLIVCNTDYDSIGSFKEEVSQDLAINNFEVTEPEPPENITHIEAHHEELIEDQQPLVPSPIPSEMSGQVMAEPQHISDGESTVEDPIPCDSDLTNGDETSPLNADEETSVSHSLLGSAIQPESSLEDTNSSDNALKTRTEIYADNDNVPSKRRSYRLTNTSTLLSRKTREDCPSSKCVRDEEESVVKSKNDSSAYCFHETNDSLETIGKFKRRTSSRSFGKRNTIKTPMISYSREEKQSFDESEDIGSNLDNNSQELNLAKKSSLEKKGTENSEMGVSSQESCDSHHGSEKLEHSDTTNVLSAALETLEMSTKTIADVELLIMNGQQEEDSVPDESSVSEAGPVGEQSMQNGNAEQALEKDSDEGNFHAITKTKISGSSSQPDFPSSAEESIIVPPKKTYTRKRKVESENQAESTKTCSKEIELYSCDDLGYSESPEDFASHSTVEKETENNSELNSDEGFSAYSSELRKKVSTTYKRKGSSTERKTRQSTASTSKALQSLNDDNDNIVGFEENSTNDTDLEPFSKKSASHEKHSLDDDGQSLPLNEGRPRRAKRKLASECYIYDSPLQTNRNNGDSQSTPIFSRKRTTKIATKDSSDSATKKQSRRSRTLKPVTDNLTIDSPMDLTPADASKEYDFSYNEERLMSNLSLPSQFSPKTMNKSVISAAKRKSQRESLQFPKKRGRKPKQETADSLFNKILNSPPVKFKRRLHLTKPLKRRPLKISSSVYNTVEESYSLPPPVKHSSSMLRQLKNQSLTLFSQKEETFAFMKEKAAHDVRVRVQPGIDKASSTPSKPVSSSTNGVDSFTCAQCGFETHRMDNFIWHAKSCQNHIDQYCHEEVSDMDRRQRIRGELIDHNVSSILQDSTVSISHGEFESGSSSSKRVHFDSSEDVQYIQFDDSTSEMQEKLDFSQEDIVWVEWKRIYWPALVNHIYPKEKLASIIFVDLPTKKKTSMKVSFRKLNTFNNADLNKQMLENGRTSIHGEAFVKAVQKAEDFTRKRLLGVDLTSSQFFGNIGIDQAMKITVADVPLPEVLKCIKEGKVDDYLVGIYEKTIASERHRKFFDGIPIEKQELQEKSWFGPIEDKNEQTLLYDHFSHLFNKRCKYEDSHFILRYIYQVWCPEAIVKAISVVMEITSDEAEFIFNKSGIDIALKDHRNYLG